MKCSEISPTLPDRSQKFSHAFRRYLVLRYLLGRASSSTSVRNIEALQVTVLGIDHHTGKTPTGESHLVMPFGHPFGRPVLTPESRYVMKYGNRLFTIHGGLRRERGLYNLLGKNARTVKAKCQNSYVEESQSSSPFLYPRLNHG